MRDGYAFAAYRLPPIISRRKGALLVIALVAGALVAGVVTFSQTEEPQFDGKNLSYWLEEFSRPPNQDQRERAAAALKSMGTNAVPFLMEDLRSRDSTLLRHWNSFVEKLGLTRLKMETAWHKRDKASRGFFALGALSDPIVAELERTLKNQADIESQHQALWQLQNIGPRALPVLLRYKDPAVDGAITTVLDRDTRDAIPVLVTALKSDSPDERLRAAAYSSDALKNLMCACRESPDDAEIAANQVLQLVLALIDSTRDSSDKVRNAAKDTLVSFHAHATGETNVMPPRCAVVVSNALLEIYKIPLTRPLP